MLGGARRVLMVHAHPDDETLLTGALVVELVAAGVQVDVVTCTRGEEGEVVAGALPDGAALGPVREAELAAAVAALGVARHAWLGTAPAAAGPTRVYRDSGMAWDGDVAVAAPQTGEHAFSRQALADEVADLAALVEAWRPDALLSYDETGTYGHPDHVRAHVLTTEVASRTGLPCWEVLPHRCPALPAGEGVPAAEWVSLDPARREAWLAAHDAHRTQFTRDGMRATHSGGQTHPLVTRVGLRRLAG